MKTISAIFAILLVFLFLGPLGAFIITAGEAAQQAGGTGAQINNTKAMTQFIMYSTITAYQCSGNGAFQKGSVDDGPSYWDSWERLKNKANQHGDFEALNKSYPRKTELNCYGVENKLPLSQGFADEANFMDEDSWINDQQGKFSKRSFEITGEKGVDLGPCLVHNDDNSNTNADFSYFITDNTEPNVIQFTHEDEAGSNPYGRGFDENNGEMFLPEGESDDDPSSYFNFEKHCMNPSPVLDTQRSDDGPMAVLNVIKQSGNYEKGLYGIEGTDMDDGKLRVEGFSKCNIGAGHSCKGPGHKNGGLKLRQWKLCPGTKGYIQTNTGKNSWEEVGGDFEGNASYTMENTPGKPDIEAAGDSKANRIHPYIVITEHELPDDNGNCQS